MERGPETHQEPTVGSHAVTDIAHVALSDGSFDVLRAIHFSRRFPPHFHDTFAIGVVESGATRLHTRRGEWIARAGTILAFSPGEIHGAEPLSEDGYTYRMVYPTVTFMREIGIDHPRLESGSPLFRIPVIDDPSLGRRLQRAHVPLMDGTALASAEAQLLMSLRQLVARWGADVRSTLDPDGAHRAIVERAQDFLHARLAQKVSLAALADVCGMSPFHLIRVFRRVVGVPPYAYLVQLRVNRAQAMLCEGWSLADVAYSCGFADQSHLTRTFKNAVGVPPGKYARSKRARAA
jgi:AraC-like DNA-binding protein/quercetin dioxygenase-like cupin family protein